MAGGRVAQIWWGWRRATSGSSGGAGPGGSASGSGSWRMTGSGGDRRAGCGIGILLVQQCQGRYHSQERLHGWYRQTAGSGNGDDASQVGGSDRDEPLDARMELHDADAPTVGGGRDAEEGKG